MKINEFADLCDDSPLLAVKGTSLWSVDIESLDTHQLLGHYTLLKSRLGRAQAIKVMRELKGECLLAVMIGDLPHCAIIDWRPPKNDLVAPALFSFLRSLSFNARACILVALSEREELKTMIDLQWNVVRQREWSSLSKRIINSVPPRLGCSYVFWEENSIGRPTPLLFLDDLINQEMLVSWKEFSSVAYSVVQNQHFAHPEIEELLNNS